MALRTDNVRMNLVPARSLVIAFTGLHPATEFEFSGLLNRTDSATILVKDPLWTWYHGPLLNETWGCRILAKFLAKKAEGYEQVVCIGSSMGGYAALLFGKLIGATQIIAFSPQTVIDPATLRRIGDGRYLSWLDEVAANSPDSALFDCSRVPARRPNQKIDIYVSKRDALDGLHADPLSEQDGVTIHHLDHLQHTLVAPLRFFGILRRLISSACDGAPLPDVSAEVGSEVALRKNSVTLAEPILTSHADRQIRISINVRFLHPRGVPKLLYRLYRRPVHEPLFVRESLSNSNNGGSYSFFITFEYKDLVSGSYELEILLWEGGFYFDEIGNAPTRLSFDIEAEPKISFLSIPDGRSHPMQRQEPLHDEVVWEFAPDSQWRRRFLPDAGEIRCAAGSLSSGRFQIPSGSGGYALYGPYVDLPAGNFVARIRFAATGLHGAGFIDVASQGGRRVLDTRRVEAEELAAKAFAEIAWSTDDTVDDVEIRFKCDAGFTGKILDLEIERKS